MKSNPWFYIFCFVAFITLFGHIANSYTAATYYDYARYPYKKKQRNVSLEIIKNLVIVTMHCIFNRHAKGNKALL